MTQVSMQQVKELRERTQAGLNDCRGALIEASGDMDKAVDIILKKGLAKSAKRAGAVATEGEIAARVASDNKSGILVEINIQTDFAARNDDFKTFVKNVVSLASSSPAEAELSTLPYPGGGGSVEEVRQALVGKLGENITLRRWSKLSSDSGLVHSYVHMGGKIGVLLGLQLGDKSKASDPAVVKFADDTAMQIAAMAPLYLAMVDIPADAKARQTDIFEAQLAEEGKPAAARPKIIEGKIVKWAKEVCLAEQVSVLETEKTIDQIRAEVSRAVGTDVAINAFVRYQLGEGIEKKKSDDFATEVMKMSQS
jgi:elongation factor Ts